MKAEELPSGLSRTVAVTQATGAVGGASGWTEPGGAASITAEMPAVSAPPSYGVMLPDGRLWYPGSKRRLPAPLLLRVVVWALAFLVVIAAAGVYVIRYHPTWVGPLRRVVPAASARAGDLKSQVASPPAIARLPARPAA